MFWIFSRFLAALENDFAVVGVVALGQSQLQIVTEVESIWDLDGLQQSVLFVGDGVVRRLVEFIVGEHVDSFSDVSMMQEWLARRSLFAVSRQAHSDHILQIFRIHAWNSIVYSFYDFFLETVNIIGHERRVEGCQLIKNAAQRPYIAFSIVGNVTRPDFRTSIIRCASLSDCQSTFTYFWDIQVG